MRKDAGNGLGDTVGLLIVRLGHHNSDPRGDPRHRGVPRGDPRGGMCDSYDGNGSRRRFL